MVRQGKCGLHRWQAAILRAADVAVVLPPVARSVVLHQDSAPSEEGVGTRLSRSFSSFISPHVPTESSRGQARMETMLLCATQQLCDTVLRLRLSPAESGPHSPKTEATRPGPLEAQVLGVLCPEKFIADAPNQPWPGQAHVEPSLLLQLAATELLADPSSRAGPKSRG